MLTPAFMFTSVTRRRFTAGSYVAGRWSAGSSSDATITASVQPMPTADLLKMPEAWRTRGTVKAYSATELRVANEETQVPADQIQWNGEWWEVQTVDHHELGIAHYKAICLRVER